MSKTKKTTIEVQGTEITILTDQNQDFISLTDMLKAKDGEFFISDWLRNRNTVEFLGIWESVHNPAFNCGEFATIMAFESDRFGNRCSFDSNTIEFDGIKTALGSARLQAGGLPAISRWLSGAIPPGPNEKRNCIPEGCQP
jgi:hypothetical protein